MRFEQLKRMPNAIVKKKMYKAGKNWVVASTLAFVGGVTLFSSQALTVKADENVDSNTVKTEAVSSQDPQTQQDNAPATNTGSTSGESDSASSNTKEQSNENVVDNGQNDNEKSTSDAVPENNNDDSVTASGSVNQNLYRSAAVPMSEDADASNQETDSTPSVTKGSIGAGTLDDGVTTTQGSTWSINDAGVLNISGGSWASLVPYDESNWGGLQKENVKSVKFDGKVTAGKSISGLFDGFENLTTLVNMNKDNFDTFNTEDFSNMFEHTGLTSFDFSSLDFSKSTSMSGMFASSKLKKVDLSDMDFPNNSDYALMFYNCIDLEKANLSGLHFYGNNGSNAVINSMFQEDYSLKSIDLSKVNTSEVGDMGQLFYGDTSLKSVDLSSFTFNSDTGSVEGSGHMLEFQRINSDYSQSRDAPKINSVVLNSKLQLTYSGLDFDNSLYKGWESKDYSTDGPITSRALTNLYNGKTQFGTDTQTWTLVPKETVNYTINYYIEGQDPTTAKLITSKNGSKLDGEQLTIEQIPGYNLTADSANPVTVDYSKGKGQIFNVFVTSHDPYVLGITIHYDDDPSKDISNEPATLRVNPVSAESEKDFQDVLDELPNSNKTLDLNKTTFNLGELLGLGSNKLTIDEIINSPELSGLKGEKNLQTIINTIIDYYVEWIPSSGNESMNIDDFVDAYYKKYEAPATIPSDNNGSSSSSSSTTEPDREIDDINQTSAIYSDQPKVQLYDYDGNLIDGAFLNPNTSWYNDRKMILNGKTYYRVSTGKWVSADDVYVYVANNTYVRVYEDNYGHITNIHGKTLNRELKPATDWFSDRTMYINGEKYYRVATDEFVNANNVYEYTYDSPVISTNKVTSVYDEKGNQTTIQLPTNSSYKTDRYETINGEKYYRVATNEFVKAEDVNL